MKEPSISQLLPYDQHNRELESHVHPLDWQNPDCNTPYHLVVIGAGTAGLVTASVAAGLGARVALIERQLMGGDCLTVGCVPSKGVIASARIAAIVRDAASFGVNIPKGSEVDFERVMQRMRSLRSRISPVDSARRFKEMGVDVYFGNAKFLDGTTILVSPKNHSDSRLEFRKAVIATGARASAPPIPGLDSVPFLTNENLFSLTRLPGRFGVVGAGPIGCEMAQSFARLGSEVTLFELANRILPREDTQASVILREQMERDGVNLFLDSKGLNVGPAQPLGIRVRGERLGSSFDIEVDQLLIAVGRTPNIEGLNLESVKVANDRKGVTVDDHLRTTNPRIFAAGDVCSKYQFTHNADFQARIVVQNALFAMGPFGRKKASRLTIPWATYTSPEIASVGMNEDDAKAAGFPVDTYVQLFSHVDRAILEGKENGLVKVLTRKGTDKILGATIVAENAGDLISEIVVAMNHNIGLGGIGNSIHPYPTIAESIRRTGDLYRRTRLTRLNQTMLNILRRLNVGK